MTSAIVQDVVDAAAKAAPDSPAVEVAEAAIATVANPDNPMTLISDLELAIKLVKRLKLALANSHPSVLEIVKSLF